MKINIWSDFTCPWCYIGKINLDKALKKENVEVEYVYHSFQTVDRGFYPERKAYSIHEVAKMGGMSKAQSIKKATLIEKMGKDVGVILNMNDVKMTETTNAHRLLQLAKNYNCQDEFMMESYRGVFEDGANIGDKDVLQKLAAQVGMAEKEVIIVLESNQYLDQVNSDIVDARKHMISGVPYYLFDNNDSLYGSQPEEAFYSVISKSKENEIVAGAFCSNGKCE